MPLCAERGFEIVHGWQGPVVRQTEHDWVAIMQTQGANLPHPQRSAQPLLVESQPANPILNIQSKTDLTHTSLQVSTLLPCTLRYCTISRFERMTGTYSSTTRLAVSRSYSDGMSLFLDASFECRVDDGLLLRCRKHGNSGHDCVLAREDGG